MNLGPVMSLTDIRLWAQATLRGILITSTTAFVVFIAISTVILRLWKDSNQLTLGLFEKEQVALISIEEGEIQICFRWPAFGTIVTPKYILILLCNWEF